MYRQSDAEFSLFIGDTMVEGVQSVWLNDEGTIAKAIIALSVTGRRPDAVLSTLGHIEMMKDHTKVVQEPIEMFAPKGFRFWIAMTDGEEDQALTSPTDWPAQPPEQRAFENASESLG